MPPPQPTLNKLDVLRSQTLTRLVQEEVIRQIKAGELLAGAKLNELEIAERLQISRSPAREALAALEEAGLVRLEKNRGAFVREISDAEAAELYEVRRGLDETAGRLLAMRITNEQIKRLKKELDLLDEAAERGELDTYFQLNIAFHDNIMQMTENFTLLEIYRKLINRTYLLRRRGLSRPDSIKSSRKEHRLIVEALERRDSIQASRRMGEHVALGFSRFRKAIETSCA